MVAADYLRDEVDILLFMGAAWSARWKNLRGAAPVTARGRRLAGNPRAETGGDAVAEGLGEVLKGLRGVAGR